MDLLSENKYYYTDICMFFNFLGLGVDGGHVTYQFCISDSFMFIFTKAAFGTPLKNAIMALVLVLQQNDDTVATSALHGNVYRHN